MLLQTACRASVYHDSSCRLQIANPHVLQQASFCAAQWRSSRPRARDDMQAQVREPSWRASSLAAAMP